MLQYIELPAPGEENLLMVWLHGLGADGYDLEPVAQMLELRGVRHVLPHAPVRPVSINGGMAMRAWYDIETPDLRRQEDAGGMHESAAQVAALIGQARRSADEAVILAGFSQGAVISLMTAATGVPGLAGIAALSGYVPQALDVSSLAGVPVFMAHGTQDGIIPFALAAESAEAMRSGGVQIEWHGYDMQHAICQQEIFDLKTWLVSESRKCG